MKDLEKKNKKFTVLANVILSNRKLNVDLKAKQILALRNSIFKTDRKSRF